MVHPSGDVPINGADFIPGLILAHLVKIHPLTFEYAVVLARERFAHEPVGADLDLADFLDDFAGNHGFSKTALSDKFDFMNAKEIIDEIRNLSSNERMELLERLRSEFMDEFESFEPELTPQQVAELERRAEEAIENPKSGIPWEEVRAKMYKKYVRE